MAPQKADALRRLLSSEEQFIAAGTLTVLTARIAQRASLPALYVSGRSVAALHRAIPDYGILEPPEMIAVAGRIANSVSIPTVADAGTLGGNVASVFRWTREYEQAGIAGIVMTDEAASPRVQTEPAALFSIEDMQGRIRAAMAARTDRLVIAVRSRCRGSSREVADRGLAYAEAGADNFVITSANETETSAIAQGVPIPCSAIAIPVGAVDNVRMIISTGWELASAAKFHEQGAKEYRQTVRTPPDRFQRASDFYSLLDEDAYLTVITDWATDMGGEVARAWRALQ